MFRSTVAAAVPPSHDVVDPPGEPVPLSVLALDLPAPGEGWSSYLHSRGIEIVADDIGTQAIARSDAKKLFMEQAENEVRKAQMRAAAEQRAIEQDQQYRRQLYAGIPAGLIPAELTPPLQC